MGILFSCLRAPPEPEEEEETVEDLAIIDSLLHSHVSCVVRIGLSSTNQLSPSSSFGNVTAKSDSFIQFSQNVRDDSHSSEEDVCPTCFEEYNDENPKIIAKCSHHYHLGCIYEWMERSTTCPACSQSMIFNEVA